MKKIKVILFASVLLISISAVPEFNPIEEVELYLPDDLEATLWAESPMFFNPTNMDVDEKGRIWITEAVNYRNYNNDSTEFLHNEAGDRVMILTDTDQDGVADKSQVFVQDIDLRSPLGIAVIGNEVFVSCAPHLIKYTDTDGDDKADKKEIFLTGFGGFDHDHSLHSIVGGPDGRLYFNVGNAGPHTVTDKSGFTLRSGSMYTGGSPYNTENSGSRVSDDGRVWVGGLQLSIQPDGEKLKVLAHNFRNSFETYIDGNGDMWQNDNDDQVVTCRVSWLPEGANAGYFNEDGTRYWGADQRPGQDMMSAHWHQDDPGVMPYGDKTGAGSPTGMLRIEGDQLGQDHLGKVISVDAGRNALYAYQPTVDKSGFRLNGHRNTFVTSNRTDEPGYKWNDERFIDDKSKWFRPADAVIGTDGALYIADWYDAVVGGHQIKDKKGYGRIYRITPKNKKLISPKINFKTLAGQIEAFKNPAVNVRFKAAQLLAASGEVVLPEIEKLLSDKNAFTRTRAIWLISQLGEPGVKKVENIFKSGNETDRIVAFRALKNVLSKNELLKLISVSIADKSEFLQREAIVALEPFAYAERSKFIASAVKKSLNTDRYFLNAIDFSLKEKKDAFYQQHKKWLSKSDKYLDLVANLVPTNAVDYFFEIASNSQYAIERRLIATNAIAFINSKQAVDNMQKLALSDHNEIKEAATYWIAYRSTNDWLDLHDWKDATAELKEKRQYAEMEKLKTLTLNEHIEIGARQRALKKLTSSKIGGQIVIDMVQNNLFDNKLLLSAKEQLLSHPDETINFQSKKLFEQKVNIYDESLLNIEAGEILKGKYLAENYCTSCHVIEAKGQQIGPELTAIGSKLDKTGLFDAITNPNSSIVFGYETTTVKTKDGKTLFGFVISDNAKSISIRDLSGNVQSVLKPSIVSLNKNTESIMPSVSAFNLSQPQLNDLITYLSTLK